MTRCRQIKHNGDQCESQAITDREFCFTHSPEVENKRTEARQRGGQNGKKYPDEPISQETKIVNMQDVIDVLSDTINRVRMQNMSPQKANCIGYLLNVAVKAIEKKDLEARIEHLESLFSARE